MRSSGFVHFASSKLSRIGLAALAVALAPVAASAQFSGLFNTGVDAANVKLAAGATDQHYKVVENALAQAIAVNLQGSYAPSATAAYIWQQQDGNPGSVTRTFRTTFTFSAGFNPLTATLSGKWSTDNAGLNIVLNGVNSNQTSGGFGSFTNFIISSGFQVGLNTLDFVVQDQGAPGGFAASDFSGSASPITAVLAPEPSTVVLLAAGLAAMAFAGSRRKRNV